MGLQNYFDALVDGLRSRHGLRRVGAVQRPSRPFNCSSLPDLWSAGGEWLWSDPNIGKSVIRGGNNTSATRRQLVIQSINQMILR